MHLIEVNSSPAVADALLGPLVEGLVAILMPHFTKGPTPDDSGWDLLLPSESRTAR